MRSGKAPVSCVPCAKRKVRCDKQQPCCHCKRRPQDTCEYPSVPSGDEELSERVAQLEAYIRRLGGNPRAALQTPSSSSSSPQDPEPLSVRKRLLKKPNDDRSCSPLSKIDAPGLLSHDEEATYIESPMWYSWGESKHPEEGISGTSARRPRLASPSDTGTGYAPTILDPMEVVDDSPSDIPTLPVVDHSTIWAIFIKNVHPLVKIFFDWEVEPLMRRASHAASDLSSPEKTLINAIIFLTATSVPKEDCMSMLKEEKHMLLDRFQRCTEKALLLVGYATTSNKLTFQAFMLYLQAMNERAHPAALFSLMGIANRVAERMGLHRDGEVLGLSVLRSEERRRMWWQLQYMELTVANHVGAMSSSVFGKWDAKLPANLDDNDLSPEMGTLPAERAGLTSMSNCLWKYFTLHMHRELRWASDSSQPWERATAMINNIEESLRVKFVQHCDLLDPLHVNLQLGICQVIIAARRAVRQPSLVNAKISDMSRRERDELLDICMKNLEYCILIQTNEVIKGYLWHNATFFPWAAFVYVILEATHRSEEEGVQKIWAVIRRTYETHIELRTAVHRQDVVFCARITTIAWQKYSSHLQKTSTSSHEASPQWIADLYQTFNLQQPGSSAITAEAEAAGDTTQPFVLDFDLDMIDWSAWDKAYLDASLFSNTS